jgi:hypothetical protein
VDPVAGAAGAVPRFKGAATLRRYRRPPTDICQELLAYVRAHADVLEPAHRAVIMAALTIVADDR